MTPFMKFGDFRLRALLASDVPAMVRHLNDPRGVRQLFVAPLGADHTFPGHDREARA